MTSARRYGWVRDLPDHRDHLFAAHPTALATAPPKLDLGVTDPPAYDQGDTSSCTGNGVAFAVWFDRRKQGLDPWAPSRLFPYYNARVKERAAGADCGAQIRDVVKSLATYGVCPETDWPFDPVQVTTRPSQAAYAAAKPHPAVAYQRVPQTLAQMRVALAAGWPIVLGISLFESFESDDVAKSGHAPMPHPGEGLLGGHCVVLEGYDDATQLWTLRNSWGNWGANGRFTLPYSYLLSADLAADFWQIRTVA